MAQMQIFMRTQATQLVWRETIEIDLPSDDVHYYRNLRLLYEDWCDEHGQDPKDFQFHVVREMEAQEVPA